MEVTELHHALSEVPATANRVVAVLSRICNAEEDRGRIPEGSNPCRLVVKYRERPRERFLTDAEVRRLGRALDEAETCKGVSAHAVAAIRLLLLTGCRKGEILGLRWDEVDLEAGELRLADSKTGRRTAVPSPEAVLSRVPRLPDNPHVIPGRPMRDLNAPWEIVRARAGIEDMRIQSVRLSCAPRALALEEGLPMTGRLPGRANAEPAARRARLDRDPVRDPAVRVPKSKAAEFLVEDPADPCATVEQRFRLPVFRDRWH